MRKLLALVPLVLAAACSAGNAQDNEDRQAGGQQGRRDFQVGAFDKVAWKARTTSSSPSAASPRSAPRAMPRRSSGSTSRVENGALRIGTRREQLAPGGHRGHVTVHVTAPALSGASIGGSGDMRIDRVQGADLRRLGRRLGRHGDRRAAGAAWPASTSPARAASAPPASAEQASLSIAGSGDLGLDGLRDPARLGLGGRLGRHRRAGERGGRGLAHGLGRHQRPRRRPLQRLEDGLRRRALRRLSRFFIDA